MSWHLEGSTSDNNVGEMSGSEVRAIVIGAVGGVASMKGPMLVGATVAGPVGAAAAGIGWVFFSIAKSLAISGLLDGQRPGS